MPRRTRHPAAHFVWYNRYNFEYNPNGTPNLPVPDLDPRFFWTPGVVEDVLERAGLRSVTRHPTVVPQDALARFGDEFWAELRASPTFTVRTATL